MKFSAQHYNELKQAIINCDIDIAQSIDNYKSKGLSIQRLLWDIFWLSKYSKNDNFRAAHYNDSHIETALKNIVSELTK